MTVAVWVNESAELSTPTTAPTGTPGINGLLPSDPFVKSVSPALIVPAGSSKTREYSVEPSPDRTPMLWLRAIRTPTLKLGSLINNTIAELPVVDFTRPTSPFCEITVISEWIPLALPASIVIVCEKLEADPRAITLAATTL